MVLVLGLDLTKEKFQCLVFVLIPTNRCELRFGPQKPNLESPILTLEIGYPHNIEQDVFQTKTPYPNYSFYHGCSNVKCLKS